MTVIKAEDMHCEKCAERIMKAMSEAKLDVQVNLENKEVTVKGCDQCVKTALEVLDDLGFEGVIG